MFMYAWAGLEGQVRAYQAYLCMHGMQPSGSCVHIRQITATYVCYVMLNKNTLGVKEVRGQ